MLFFSSLFSLEDQLTVSLTVCFLPAPCAEICAVTMLPHKEAARCRDPQGPPLITFDGVRLGESIILPYSLKKCTVFSPSYMEI